jgi:GT2 family glycosyltransferase
VKLIFHEKNAGISAATNSAFSIASGEWIALLDHDDVLSRAALAEVALCIASHPEAEIIYSDEDKLNSAGERFDPYFKPDFSRELFRSQNYLNHLTVHRAGNIRAVGGWRTGYEGSQDYDLNLRIMERIDAARIRHIPKILYHWRAVEGSTALAGSEKGYAYAAGLRALAEHVQRTGLPASVEGAPGTPYYRLRFAIPEPAPLVSLIVPTKDKVDLLRGCLESIFDHTSYGNYEVIVVNNNSSGEKTHAYLSHIKEKKGVRVIDYQKPFNFSAINNYAVARARGSIVGLINNDIEVISPDWLTEMVSWAVQPDIGCVGAKLYYANDTIQHGGVILGIGGVAGHSHKYFPREHPGYFSRLKVVQNLSAVTGACLLVRKDVYEAVGGLNEDALTVAFNDVDFCLKVREAGYRNVWTPYAELYHLESESRGAEDNPDKVRRFQQEIRYMQERWSLDDDPFYSPHLSLEREDFSISLKPRERNG